jgi:hypothetical protein
MKTSVRTGLYRQVVDWPHCTPRHLDCRGPRGERDGDTFEKQGCGWRCFTALRIRWRHRARARPHQKFLLPLIWRMDPCLCPIGRRGPPHHEYHIRRVTKLGKFHHPHRTHPLGAIFILLHSLDRPGIRILELGAVLVYLASLLQGFSLPQKLLPQTVTPSSSPTSARTSSPTSLGKTSLRYPHRLRIGPPFH